MHCRKCKIFLSQSVTLPDSSALLTNIRAPKHPNIHIFERCDRNSVLDPRFRCLTDSAFELCCAPIGAYHPLQQRI